MKHIKINHLKFGLKGNGGRSNKGQITTPRRGALIKRNYRFLDTKRRLWTKEGAVILSRYIYDPNRSSFITLIMLPNGIMTYILAAQYAINQQRIYNLKTPPNYEIGSSQILKKIKNGTLIFNCELNAYKGSQILRSAGVSGLVLKKLSINNPKTVIKLKSGALRIITSNATACLGLTSNPNHFLIEKKKAGTTRLKGHRPYPRPSAQNPVIIQWEEEPKGVHILKIKMEY